MKIYAVQFHNGDRNEWEKISIIKHFLNKESAERFCMFKRIEDDNLKSIAERHKPFIILDKVTLCLKVMDESTFRELYNSNDPSIKHYQYEYEGNMKEFNSAFYSLCHHYKFEANYGYSVVEIDVVE